MGAPAGALLKFEIAEVNNFVVRLSSLMPPQEHANPMSNAKRVTTRPINPLITTPQNRGAQKSGLSSVYQPICYDACQRHSFRLPAFLVFFQSFAAFSATLCPSPLNARPEYSPPNVAQQIPPAPQPYRPLNGAEIAEHYSLPSNCQSHPTRHVFDLSSLCPVRHTAPTPNATSYPHALRRPSRTDHEGKLTFYTQVDPTTNIAPGVNGVPVTDTIQKSTCIATLRH